MAGISSSASSSCASYSSFGDVSVKSTRPCIKFLCSYGGKILPRYPDGKLRYAGGYTRVVAVGRSISFSELQVKLRELCGWGGTVSLRCQLPTEDLDALVSVTSDDDLADLVEEYDIASRDRLSPLKIRAFLLLLQNQSHHPSEPTASAMSPCTRPGIFASTAMAAHEHQTVSCVTSAACYRCHLGKKEEHIKAYGTENYVCSCKQRMRRLSSQKRSRTNKIHVEREYNTINIEHCFFMLYDSYLAFDLNHLFFL